MKNYFFLIGLSFLFFSCEKEKINNSNPYLPNYNFSVTIDTNLPTYSNLNFAGNGVRVFQSNIGVTGVVFVFNTGSGFTAFDGNCPNQTLGSCASMTLNGINAVCPCDHKQYSLYTGQCPGMQYPLKAYRVEANGSLLRIYN